MDAYAPATPCMKPASHPLRPPPGFAVRAARSRVADQSVAFSGPPDTPPRRSPVTVPFVWEDAPGKPKAPPSTAASPASAAATNAGGPVPEGETGDRRQDSGRAADQARGPRPLKLPPRLQQVPSFAASVDTPLSSPKTVLQGPYYGCAGIGGGGRRKPPKWARSGGAALKRSPSAGVGLFSRTWSKPSAPGSNRNRGDHERDTAGPDAPWCSPASSSSTSSSSVSTCFGGDDHGRGRPADGREVCSEEEDGSPPRASVRITRFRRNRSLPSLTTSNLWANLRRSFKQITPWS